MIAGVPKPVLQDAQQVGRTLDILRQIFAVLRPLPLEERQRIIAAAAVLIGAELPPNFILGSDDASGTTRER